MEKRTIKDEASAILGYSAFKDQKEQSADIKKPEKKPAKKPNESSQLLNLITEGLKVIRDMKDPSAIIGPLTRSYKGPPLFVGEPEKSLKEEIIKRYQAGEIISTEEFYKIEDHVKEYLGSFDGDKLRKLYEFLKGDSYKVGLENRMRELYHGDFTIKEYIISTKRKIRFMVSCMKEELRDEYQTIQDVALKIAVTAYDKIKKEHEED
ncbi:unnamed protein product [marine sediment metagenome]|uniref:Uncharacterized protein n=1 Tax=marine sediment metagenome TaxID=412755 RepID=X0RMJ2_9ZZZZ